MIDSAALLAVTTGILWGGVGVVYSLVAARKEDYATFMAMSQVFTCALAWIVMPRYHVLAAQEVTRTGELAAILVFSGVFAACGMLCMNKGMRLGHQGATWTIGQSALVLPFLAGALFWRDKVQIWNALGVGAVLAGIGLMGMTGFRQAPSQARANHLKWLIAALSALVFLGIQQTLTTLPSRWLNWSDAARLRVPLATSGAAGGYLLICLLWRRVPNARLLVYCAALSCIAIPSQAIFYACLDLFARTGRTALAYPIAVGACIVSFSLYSVFVLREKLAGTRAWGMALGSAGIVVTALK